MADARPGTQSADFTRTRRLPQEDAGVHGMHVCHAEDPGQPGREVVEGVVQPRELGPEAGAGHARTQQKEPCSRRRLAPEPRRAPGPQPPQLPLVGIVRAAGAGCCRPACSRVEICRRLISSRRRRASAQRIRVKVSPVGSSLTRSLVLRVAGPRVLRTSES